MIKEQITGCIKESIDSLVKEGKISESAKSLINTSSLSKSKNPLHGDFASNAAMIMAKNEKKPPKDVALLLKESLLGLYPEIFSKIDIAGPGFINFTLTDLALSQIVPHIAKRGADFGHTKQDVPQKVLLEFVSANPTGGLHLGHARGAFMGDGIARVLKASGFDVTREFYVNDAGNQVHTLARTIHKRYRELFGQKIEIEKGEYPGEYVKDIAKELKDRDGDKWLNLDESAWLEPLTRFGVNHNLGLIKKSLSAVNIEFDEWFFEHTLHEDKSLEEIVKVYQDRNMVYEADEAIGASEKIRNEESKASKFSHLQEGGLFLKTSLFGDDEDRIIKRKDGRFVYLTADLAYHHKKYTRGYDLLIDVLGADHAGHVGRIKAGMAALGHDQSKLKFSLVQMMRLIKDGQEVRFSKRAGEVLGIDDLILEVGVDVARFVFLMRSGNSQFDLDIDLVTKSSSDNPVFYVQYGHARMSSILAKAKETISFDANNFGVSEMHKLTLPEERELILRVSELDEVVKEAALALEPHRLIYFCQELIKIFHGYFTKYRHSEKIISDDEEKSRARLSLIWVLKQAIFNALSILGISAPERMEQASNDDQDN